MSLVIFSHGKESGPNGSKIKMLSAIAQELGFDTIAIDYTNCKNAQERVDLLKETVSKNAAVVIVLVGSSMGGYVSTVVASELDVDALFLMCPALYLNNYEVQHYLPKTNKVQIIHGWNDDVVPFENSIRFANQIKATLHLVADNHRLINSHGFLKQAFEALLRGVENV